MRRGRRDTKRERKRETERDETERDGPPGDTDSVCSVLPYFENTAAAKANKHCGHGKKISLDPAKASANVGKKGRTARPFQKSRPKKKKEGRKVDKGRKIKWKTKIKERI